MKQSNYSFNKHIIIVCPIYDKYLSNVSVSNWFVCRFKYMGKCVGFTNHFKCIYLT